MMAIVLLLALASSAFADEYTPVDWIQVTEVLHQGPQKAGGHRLYWDGRDDGGLSHADMDANRNHRRLNS